MRHLRANERGAAALEFGLLAPIFLALLLALIDLSIYFGARAIADGAVENAARAVRLGVLKSGDNGAGFRAALCSNLVFLDCNRFTFSIQSFDRLSVDTAAPQVDKDGKIVNPKFDVGGPSKTVVVTIVYVHKFIIPYVAQIFGDDGLNEPFSRAIVSFLVVKNEPYPEPQS